MGKLSGAPFTVATVLYAVGFAVTTYCTTSSGNVRTTMVLTVLSLPAFLATEAATKKDDATAIVDSWSKEFVGMAVMVAATCSPGPAVGHLGAVVEWPFHWLMMALADYGCGGPQVNPAITTALWINGFFSKTIALTNIMAQIGGGIVGWLALYGLGSFAPNAVGGPSPDARLPYSYLFSSEFVACFVLAAAVFSFATTKFFAPAAFDAKIYALKMTLINATVRSIIVFVGATGPAINPALATGYAFVFQEDGALPSAFHFAVYWAAGLFGGATAGLLWKALASQKDLPKAFVAVTFAVLALAFWSFSLKPQTATILEDLAKNEWNAALNQRHPLSKLFRKMPQHATPPPGVTNAKPLP
mmetsp:Transcript_3962/g.12311  ORF Transcript_3962/g.12311 Transcript_3962/m.12311 type:complete len:359 (-) Transcript_3962:301-1377(-)